MKRYIRSSINGPITKDLILSTLHAAGIDTTVATYELSQEMFDRFSDDEQIKRTFTAPGDWMAVLGMRLHGDISLSHLNEWFNLEQFKACVDRFSTVRSMLDDVLQQEEEYHTHYLKNISTGQFIYKSTYYREDAADMNNEW